MTVSINIFLERYLMSDFYSFINEKWLNNIKLNDDQVRTNSFECIARQVKKQLYKILFEEQEKKSFLGNLFHKLCSESECINCFDKYIQRIKDIQTMDDYIIMISQLSIYGCSLFFEMYVSRDIKHPDKYIMAFEQMHCTLPSPSYYDKYESQYKKFINSYCNEIGIEANGIFDLENRLRKFLISPETKRNIDKVYNVMSVDDFNRFWSIDISHILREYNKFVKLQVTEICVDDMYYIKELCKVFTEYDLDLLKRYMIYSSLIGLPFFCKPTVLTNLEFDFFKRELSSISKDKPRHSRALQYIMNYVPDLLGDLYLKKHMNSETEHIVKSMVQMIKHSTKDIICNCSWISTVTKERIQEKIDSMGFHIGGTDIPKTYDDYKDKLSMSLLEMTLAFEKSMSIENLKRLGTLVDKRRWSMASYSVNAYYSPLNNEIVIPCAMLNEPFFSMDVDIYENLGGIGSVIAHEISHGFDDQGRQFDKNGYHRNWWLEEDVVKYKSRTQEIIDYYNNFRVLNTNISGKLTIGENIADYTGILILTNILKLKSASKCQYARLYASYAKIWRQKIRSKEMIHRIKTDPHAPPRLRTNVVLSHIPEFKWVFNLKADHPMYIANEKQFMLWK